MRTIDADALRDRLQNLGYDDWNQGTTTTWAEAFYECADIVADAPTIEPEPQWIPCSERLPENDEEVFVYLFEDSPYIAWMDDGRWRTNDFVVDVEDEPTEWMQLPKKEVLYET